MSESQNKPREFWITCKPYHLDPLDQCENVMKYVASYPHEYGVHVREVSAEIDAAVERMRAALVYYSEMRFNREVMQWMPSSPDTAKVALEFYDQARGDK